MTCVASASRASRPCRTRSSIAARNAASVLPDPVGAAMRVCRPALIAGHASACAAVGPAKVSANQFATAGWNSVSRAPDRRGAVELAPAPARAFTVEAKSECTLIGPTDAETLHFKSLYMAPHRALVTPPRGHTTSPRKPGNVAKMTSKPQTTVALNDGAAMPQFGLGVFQTPPDAAEQVVKMAVDGGYRLVDTASMYRNEDGVGNALVGRTDVFITTKLGNSDHGFDEAMRAFDASIKKLRRETLDLYLIHWPRPRVNRYAESWKALVRLQKDGRICSIGVSNFNSDHLERIIGETGVTPSVNQIELHPKFQQKGLRAFHDQKGIKTESWSPLGRGGLLSEAALVEIAAKRRKTPAQVVIRWHLDSGLIVIPKTVRIERLRENVGALAFRLDDDDIGRIEALDSPAGRIGPDPATSAF